MSMKAVNGYVCRNRTDVEPTKRGVDPPAPKPLPVRRAAGAPDGLLNNAA